MGNWYRVTKRINGRYYDYWQRTYRLGKSVKTKNKYIGPAGKKRGETLVAASGPTQSPSASDIPPLCARASVSSISPRTISAAAPVIPEEAIHQITPFTVHLTGKDRRDYERDRQRERREDEEIQYGNLKDRIKKHKAMYRAVKRKTRGIKAVNPFIAQPLLKKS